jgi:hypothetical protein
MFVGLMIAEHDLAAAALDALSHRTERRERILTTMLSSISDFAGNIGGRVPVCGSSSLPPVPAMPRRGQ